MRLPFKAVISLFLFLSPVTAESLSRADLDELLARLEKITENASEKLDERYKNAIDTFSRAMQSNSAAIELYLMCIEKSDFVDKQKKNQDFREWKRAQEEKQKDPHFRDALRHQLNWLCLTLRANIRPEKKQELYPEVLKAMADLHSNVDHLEGNFETLSQDMRNTVFFKAYELGDLKGTEWPESPMKIAEIFDSLLMPPSRQKKDYKELAALWDKRILMEQTKVQIKEKKEKATGLTRPGEATPAINDFRENTLPQLTWSKYVDLFKSGDQKGIALVMLNHIATHIKNAHAKSWADEFKTLIAPEKA